MSSTSLKDYLKRYESNGGEEESKKRKKKKVKKSKVDANGVLVVDEDPVWQKPVKLDDEEDENDSPDEKPVLEEDVDVKRMKRLEQLRARRPYNGISEDGSGWVTVSDVPKSSSGDDRSGDISPPRRGRTRNDTPSPDPGLRDAVLCEGDEDLSPPRPRRRRYDSPSPEHAQRSSDISPPRRSGCRSPIVNDSRNLDREDLSPLRKRRSTEVLSQKSRLRPNEKDASQSSVAADLSPPRKSKEKPKTGLVTGRDIKEEITKKKNEDLARFRGMDPSISGRGAEPVFRDKKKGNPVCRDRISKDAYMKSEKKEEKPKDIKVEWGKGLAQKRKAEDKLMELELEKERPFARSRDDPELDNMLKERVRWGDPMAHLVKKKRADVILPDLGEGEKMKESGFIVPQEIPSHSWLKRGLEAAPNRYGIRPGRHWDGVDRSNGYEKEFFKRTNEKQATQREAYLWSVSDILILNFDTVGRNGRAFLFSHAMNVVVGPKEDRHLMTGLHTVADIHCGDCKQVLGWKYLRAYEPSQKYKEGKFIFEKSKIVKEECMGFAKPISSNT
ncbi:yippee-like-like protein [Drosera capensis]